MIRRARPTPSPLPADDRVASSSTTSSFSYPSAAEVSLRVAGGRRRCPSTAARRRAARRLLPRRAGAAGRARRPLRRGQVDDRQPGDRGSTTSPAARCGSAASTCATATLALAARRASAWSARTRTCSTTRIRANLLYARPEATEERAVGGAGAGRRSPTSSARCPTGWTPSSATAATGCPAGRSSGWRSPGCCSRHPGIVILDEATAHLDSESRGRGAARARHRAGRAHVAGHRAPAVHDPQRRPDPGGRRRSRRRVGHARRAARARRAATPTSTAPSSPTASVERSRSPEH